jgi:hypothetical protein
MKSRRIDISLVSAIAVVALAFAGLTIYAIGQQPSPPAKVPQNSNSPASWGGNHVGKPIPNLFTATSVCSAIAITSASAGNKCSRSHDSTPRRCA